jgi:mannosyltransferase
MGKKRARMAERHSDRDRWIVLGLMILATVIRARGLTTSNLWLDEANSWQVATDSWAGLFANVLRSPLGPLYFVLLKSWIGVFGDSVLALRSLSLVASVALIPVTYTLGVRLLSRPAALLACSLLALSPLELYFAQEARMYMLVSLLGAACVLAYAGWRGDGDSGARSPRAQVMLWCYAVAGIALLFTHLVAGLLLVAINIDATVVLLRARRSARDRLAWIGANAAIAIVVLFYLGSISAGSAVSSQAWRSPMGGEIALRAALMLPFDAVHGQYFYPSDFWVAFTSLTHGSGFNRRFFELLIVQPAVLLVFVGALMAGHRAAAPRGGRRLLAIVLLVPALVVTIVSMTRGLEFPRYLLFVIPFLFLLLADGLLALGLRSRYTSIAVLVIAMLLGQRAERGVVSRDSDYRSSAELLLRDWRAGDRALIQPREMNAPLRYYLGASGRPVRGIAADGSLVDEARALSAHRTWVIIDYRSPLYTISPTEMAERFDAPIALDEYTTDATAGVRVVLLNVR